MSQVSNLVSAGSVTVDMDQLPQFLQIGSVVDVAVLDSINIIVRGQSTIQLNNNAQIQALMKLENDGILADNALAKRLMLADGEIDGRTTATIVQAAGSTETSAIFANSIGQSSGRMARSVAVTPVIASGNLEFKGFDMVYFLPANVDHVQVTYENNWQEEMQPNELAGVYAANFTTEDDGLVQGFIVVPGMRAPAGFRVKRLRVYATAGGNVDVVVSSWRQL